MYQYDDVRLRKFRFEDIPQRIEWINNAENNAFLNIDLPLEYDKTVAWYERSQTREDRYDGVVEYLGEPVGLWGLTNIDYRNEKAEEYLIIGNTSYKRRGIATKAGTLLLLYGFENLKLNRIYGIVDVGNLASLRMDQKRGMNVEGYLRESVKREGVYLDCYVLGITRDRMTIPDDVHWEEDE